MMDLEPKWLRVIVCTVQSFCCTQHVHRPKHRHSYMSTITARQGAISHREKNWNQRFLSHPEWGIEIWPFCADADASRPWCDMFKYTHPAFASRTCPPRSWTSSPASMASVSGCRHCSVHDMRQLAGQTTATRTKADKSVISQATCSA